jgi:hypothetical protein
LGLPGTITAGDGEARGIELDSVDIIVDRTGAVRCTEKIQCGVQLVRQDVETTDTSELAAAMTSPKVSPTSESIHVT